MIKFINLRIKKDSMMNDRLNLKNKKINLREIKKEFPFLIYQTFNIYTIYLFFIKKNEYTAIISFSLCILALFTMRKIDKKYYRYIISMSIILASGFLCTVINENATVSELSFALSYMIFGLVLLQEKISYKISLYVFCGISLLFIYFIIIGASPNNIFINTSQNTISVIMIIQCLILYISCIKNGKPISFIPAFVTFSISLWGLGRSGIISSGLLMGLSLILKMKEKQVNLKNILFVSLGLGIFLFLVYYFYDYLYEFLLSKAIIHFSDKGITDASREMVLKHYFSDINLKNVFFGEKLHGDYVFESLNRNLHNSFLKLHAFFGIIGIMVILFQTISQSIKFIKHKNYLFLGFLQIQLVFMV